MLGELKVYINIRLLTFSSDLSEAIRPIVLIPIEELIIVFYTSRIRTLVAMASQPTCDEWTFPYVSVGRVHFLFRGIGSNFSFLFHFSMKIMKANRIAPDRTPHLWLFCLPMSHKKDDRLI